MSDTPAGPRGPEGAGGPQQETGAPPGGTGTAPAQPPPAPAVWPPTPGGPPASRPAWPPTPGSGAPPPPPPYPSPAYPSPAYPAPSPSAPQGAPPYPGAPAGWAPPPWPPPPGTRSGPPWKIIIPVVALVVLLGIGFVVAVSVVAYKQLSGQVKGANAYMRTLKANDLAGAYTDVCDSAKATLTQDVYVRRSTARMAVLGPISSYFVSPANVHIRNHPDYETVNVKVVAGSGTHHYLGEMVHEDGTWHWCGTARRVGETADPAPLP